MKHLAPGNWHLARLCVAAAAMAALLAPRPAAAKDPDDKKPAPAALTQNDEYRLGAGDKLRVEVYKDAQLSQSVQIRPDGKITLPLVGDMTATGLTPIELRDEIAKKLKDYINNPTVTVIVVEADSAHAYVMGEVAHPGAVSLHGPVTIVQAIAMAGGFKEFANTKDVKILRGSQTLKFNYKDMLNGDAHPMMLRPGDTVIVP
ncbi:MAG TPA: polysaccharide biosynthesis/export family protein [Vicinamibacterales bacterium]|nr:polysaccharide biosynthesis/export family protein [Vicinamibacterales bacterium]